MQILLAEDDRGARTRLSQVLGEWGYMVTAVATGAEALAELEKEHGPRLALLDWLLPEKSGLDVCRAIRAHEGRPYVYVLLLSQKGTQEDVIKGLNAGADDYLVKPVNPAELFARLRSGRRVLENEAELIRMREELSRQALFDPVTQTMNRRGGFLAMQRELDRSRRTGNAVAVVLCDLDHFKAVNDEHGHLAGDEVLRAAAARIAKVIRPYDSLSRYGGEEFLVVLPGCTADFAVAITERCRQRLESTPVEVGEKRIHLTASFGVCASPFREGLAPEDLIAAADAALYRAKRSGRNRVEVAAPPAPHADTTT
jgi:two-component system cell cycle response regulator